MVVALAGRLDARAARLQSAPARVERRAREREQQRQSARWNTPEPVALALEASVADRGWQVALDVAPGDTVAVVGPNGAGKSTLLGLLAGGLRADSGRATVGGTVLFDGRAHLAPHQRPVAILHQDPLLFPHLSVLENVEFGPRSRGMSRLEARAAACTWLAEADALDLAERMPRSLSGGQAQRVAVARALAAEPGVLLLDEPLSSLDVAAAPGIRSMLARVLADRTAVLVTHDVYDAHVLADRVVVLDRGHVAEVRPPAELFARPRTRFAAQLAGLELLEGRMHDGAFEVDGVALPVDAADGPAWGALAPDAVRLEATDTSVDLAVTLIEPRGDHVRVHLGPLAADVRPADAARLAVGDVVPVTVPAQALTVYGR
nr:ABC transporter ATP-binding protein [Herbiconiux sp. SYSU D00978]